MSEQLAKPVGNGVKGQAAVLDFDASDRPQLFADGLHIVPHWNGTVAIGSTSERLYEHTDVDAQLDDVIASAKSLFPVLADASVIERWAGLRPRAKSRAPMLGAYGDVYVANGGFKIGFGMAPRVGETMAALVLDGVDEIPDAFRVEASL
jgi:glycine/D-amino acid oxidase-like deaminating enzyme